MKRAIVITSLLFVFVSVFATDLNSNYDFSDYNSPYNITDSQNAEYLDDFLGTNLESSCTDNGNIIEYRCFDQDNNELMGANGKTLSECKLAGTYTDPEGILPEYDITTFNNKINNEAVDHEDAFYCYSENLANINIAGSDLSVRKKIPGIGSNPQNIIGIPNPPVYWNQRSTERGGTNYHQGIGNIFPNDCDDMDYSLDRYNFMTNRLTYTPAITQGSNIIQYKNPNIPSFTFEDYEALYENEPLCVAELSSSTDNFRVIFDEEWIDNGYFGIVMAPYLYSQGIFDTNEAENNPDYFEDLSYESKCNYIGDFFEFIYNIDNPNNDPVCIEYELSEDDASKLRNVNGVSYTRPDGSGLKTKVQFHNVGSSSFRNEYYTNVGYYFECNDNVVNQNKFNFPLGENEVVFSLVPQFHLADSLIGINPNRAYTFNQIYFYDDFEISTYEQIDLQNNLLYNVQTECIESPIKTDIKLSLRDYPDYEIKDNIIPKNQFVLFDISETTPADSIGTVTSITSNNLNIPKSLFCGSGPVSISLDQVNAYSNLFNCNDETDFEPQGSFSSVGKTNVSFEFNYNNFQKTQKVVLDIQEFIDVNIRTTLTSNNIMPGESMTFELSAKTFNGADIKQIYFSPGQTETAIGKILNIDGQLQCKESVAQTSCSIYDAEYMGTPSVGGDCSCTPGILYQGEIIVDKDSSGALGRAFNGGEFYHPVPFTYPSKTSCGESRVCDVIFEVEDVNGVITETNIQLNMPGVQVCSSVYPNSIVGTNSSLYVGSINDGEQTCQCKYGYEPKLDDALSQLVGKSTKSCKAIPSADTNTTTNTTTNWLTQTTGASNNVWQNNQNRNWEDTQNTDLLSNKSEDKGYGLIIFGLFIVLGAGTIGGFEYYEKKKTGSYVNPFNSIKTLFNKNKNTETKSDSDYQVSPIQKFITDARNAGESNETIRQNLISSGWPEEEINKYL